MNNDTERLLSQTEQALVAFYSGTNPGERQNAHKWLVELQNSQEGWQICWKLIKHDKSVEFQYFGSTLLHHKISRCWHELPEDHYTSLKNQLIEFICQFATGPKIILSKLCLSLASFVIHSLPEFWENGCEESVKEIQSKLALDDGHMKSVTIDYIAFLPEEFGALALSGNKKVIARSKLEQFSANALGILKTILESSEPRHLHISSLKCLAAWVQFGASIFDCQQLLPTILNKFHDESLTDNISSVLVELLSHPSSFKQENSIYSFLLYLDGFEVMLKKAISDHRIDVALHICKILVAIGETHSRILTHASTDDQQKHCLQLVRLILECTGINGNYPVDETCSELTFSFWYTFQDELLTLRLENTTNYHHCLKESFVSLIQILFLKAQFPDDNVYCNYDSEEKEMFRCYRQDVQDTVMYVYSLLRERCLQYLTELLKFLLSGLKSSKWQEIEAVLYLLHGTSDYVECDESTYMQLIFTLLPSLPQHPKVMESAIFMVGSFSEWLACHSDYLQSILPILQNGITQKELTTACTLSLCDICRENSKSFPQETSLNLLKVCLDAAKSNKLGEKERLRCIESIGYILSSLDTSLAEHHQKPIVEFLFEMLNNAIKFSTIDFAAFSRVQHGINCFTAFFRSFDPSKTADPNYHPLLPSYAEFIKTIQQLISFELPESMIQDIVCAINRAVDTIRDPFYNVLSDTTAIILELFNRIPNGSILELSATIMGMLGGVVEAQLLVKEFFNELMAKCLNFMASQKAQENPDTVHGFMVLINRTIKTVPLLLLENHDMHMKTIQCALQSLGCPETPTVKSTISFFYNYINISVQHKQAVEMLNLFGQDLIANVLVCVGGHGPRSNVEFFADILLALNKNYIMLTAKWLQNVLDQEGWPSKLATKAQKDDFRKMITREKVNKRRIKEIIRDFSLICRGLHGMAYASG